MATYMEKLASNPSAESRASKLMRPHLVPAFRPPDAIPPDAIPPVVIAFIYILANIAAA
jgi:hypothetical protein